MAIKMSEFVSTNNLAILVNFPAKLKNFKSDSHSGYILDTLSKDNVTVYDYLKEYPQKRIEQALQLVKLKPSLYTVKLPNLTSLEQKKVNLAKILLLQSEVIICEHFFRDMIYGEKEYFKRFFRNLINKQNKKIILIENDMNFICETTRSFYLFTSAGKYKLITDFYDDKIYKYIDMPYTVSLVKYLESKGHNISHEITFNETLKAIYRSVSSK